MELGQSTARTRYSYLVVPLQKRQAFGQLNNYLCETNVKYIVNFLRHHSETNVSGAEQRTPTVTNKTDLQHTLQH